jgi:hypothetical protein
MNFLAAKILPLHAGKRKEAALVMLNSILAMPN